MNDSPIVSVVMSAYNGAQYLPETIESILSQEQVDLELIVVNDGSTDDSRALIENYSRCDSRVKVIYQGNRGLTRALITGCTAAQGKYIARHDVGDVSRPQRLALQTAALDANVDVSFVSCWTEFWGPEWEYLYLVKGTDRTSIASYVLSEIERHGVIDGPTHHGSVMFRRDLYLRAGGYRAEFYYGQDWDLWYRLAELGKFQTIEKALYNARVLPNSISVMDKARQKSISKLSLAALQRRQKGTSEESVLNEASAIRPNRNDKPRSAAAAAAGLYFIGESLRRNGDVRSRDYFKRALRTFPLFLKPWFRLLQGQLQQMKGPSSRSVF